MPDRTLIPDTWYKWNIFGDASRVPLYIHFVGRNYASTVPDHFLFNCWNGKQFYADMHFFDNLLPLDKDERGPHHEYLWWR